MYLVVGFISHILLFPLHYTFPWLHLSLQTYLSYSCDSAKAAVIALTTKVFIPFRTYHLSPHITTLSDYHHFARERMHLHINSSLFAVLATVTSSKL